MPFTHSISQWYAEHTALSFDPTHPLPSTSLNLLFDHPPSSSTLRPHPPFSLTPPTFARLHPPSFDLTHLPLRPLRVCLSLRTCRSRIQHFEHTFFVRSTHLPSTSLTFLRPHPPSFDHIHLPFCSHPPFLLALFSAATSQQSYACSVGTVRHLSRSLRPLSLYTFMFTLSLLTPQDRPMTRLRLRVAQVASPLRFLSLSSIFLLHL